MNAITKSAAALLVLGCTQTLPAADWPHYRGDTDDGIVADAKAPAALKVSPVWKAEVGNAFGQFAVAGGKAFIFAETTGDESLTCFDAAKGNQLWSTRIDKSIRDGQGGDGPRSTPCVDGDHVYVYSTHLKLSCLTVADGKEVWQHDVKAEFGGKEPNQWGNAVSPLIVDDLVIVDGGGKGKGILAFNKADGKLAWAKTSEAYTQATPTLATILGTQQLICFMQSGLVSVDPKTGDVLWTYPHKYKTSTAASPVVGGKNGDVVYCSAGYDVGAAACKISKEGDTWKATELWNTPGKNMSHWSTPVQKDGYIYGLFNHNDAKGPLACLDIETGTVKWSQPGFGSQGGIILIGDKLLVQTPKGDLVLVEASPDKFTEVGRANIIGGKSWTAPAYVGGMLYARNAVASGGKAEVICVNLGE